MYLPKHHSRQHHTSMKFFSFTRFNSCREKKNQLERMLTMILFRDDDDDALMIE